MEVDAAPAPLASERVLGSVDLVSQILYFHARELNGQRHTLARVRAVCSTWRDAFAAANVQIAGWHTLSWTFAGISRAKPDESFISTPDSNPSPFAWQIDLHPRLVRYKPISMEDFHENPPDPATLAWDDGRGLLVRTEVVGAYLRVLPPGNLHLGTSRTRAPSLTSGTKLAPMLSPPQRRPERPKARTPPPSPLPLTPRSGPRRRWRRRNWRGKML